MSTYKVLSKQVFRQGRHSIVPIRTEDRYDIMQWRNEQIYHLRQNNPLTKEDQDRYFNEVIAKLFTEEQPDQLLFSYLEGERCIGYGGLVHINWVDKNAEVSFIMATELEANFFAKHWKVYLNLIEKVAFEELDFHKIFTYAFDVRKYLYNALESAGFKKEAVLPEQCLFESRFIDVVIHAKYNRKISLRPVAKTDLQQTLNWATNSIIRKYALNKSKITLREHRKWFLDKLENSECLYYIAEYNAEEVGSFRLDLCDGGRALISYLLDPKYHGLGLGALLLREGIILVKNRPEIKLLVGQVLEGNKASIHVFEKLGFDLVVNESGLITYQLAVQ